MVQPPTQKLLTASLFHARPELFTGFERLAPVQPLADRADHELIFKRGTVSALQLRLNGRDQLLANLRVQLPADAVAGETYRLDFVQRDVKGGKIVGGVAMEVRAV